VRHSPRSPLQVDRPLPVPVACRLSRGGSGSIGVHLPLSHRWTTGSSWDTPAADFGERITTVEPESRIRLIPSAPSGVAKTKHI
jgi:hypothetical protein